MTSLEQHREVQAIAKQVLGRLGPSIGPKDTEQSIANRAVSMLEQAGIYDTWYYECPALVLLGSRSCESMSGRQYVASTETVGAFNLVTVDLSPLRGNVWGDCARSYYVESGRAVDEPFTPEFKRGSEVLRGLHHAIRGFVDRSTLFEELHSFATEELHAYGFENLDFLGNFGHSIPQRLEDRIYILKGNRTRLSDVRLFSFEPHIGEFGGAWGLKHEEIYYFGPDERIEPL